MAASTTSRSTRCRRPPIPGQLALFNADRYLRDGLNDERLAWIDELLVELERQLEELPERLREAFVDTLSRP